MLADIRYIHGLAEAEAFTFALSRNSTLLRIVSWTMQNFMSILEASGKHEQDQ